MKKKLLALVLVVVLALTTVISGTMAYLQDTDDAVNVMTLGNVDIELIEEERIDDSDSEHALKDFEQNKPLLPAYYEGTSIPWAGEDEWVVAGDQAWKVVADNENVIDKFVRVKNTGKTSAYVRTVFAIEVGPDGVNSEYVHFVTNSTNIKEGATWEWEWIKDETGEDLAVVNIDGTDYLLYVATYTKELPAGYTTIPSLKQIYLDKTATNEVAKLYGDTYEVLVFSQAVQAQMDTLTTKEALNEAFGEITATNHPWLETALVDSADELANALADGGDAVLTDDVKANAPVYVTGGTLNGNGNTLDFTGVTTTAWPNAYGVTLGNGGSTVENLTVTNADYAIGSTATTDDVYIKNVTTDYVTYAINGNGNGTNSVYVTDSTINGWNSYSNIKLFSFDNCKLAKGNSSFGYLVVYGDTTFTDCTFENFAMCARKQNDAVVAAGKTVSFTNCSYVTAEGTVKVTADNFEALFKAEGDDTDFGYLSQCNVVIDGVKVSWN